MMKRVFIPVFIIAALSFMSLAGIRILYGKTPALSFPAGLQRCLRVFCHSKTAPDMSHFEAALLKTLRELEVRDEDIRTGGGPSDSVRVIAARIPRGRPIEWIALDICRSAESALYYVEDCVYDRRKKTCVIEFAAPKAVPRRIRLTLTPSERFFTQTAMMAILIEDFEFQADKTTTDILSFPQPLTISLNPLSSKSVWTAQAAGQYNKEVVIRLAFEPLVKVAVPPSLPFIMIHFSADSIRHLIAQSVSSIPNFSGFINVFGSRAMEDSRIMDIVLREVKKRHGYFVETMEARNSVAASLSASLGLPYAAVTSRIPPSARGRDIEEQLAHQCIVAQKRGRVLVLARASAEFAESIRRMLDTFRQNGIRLVYVSELAGK